MDRQVGNGGNGLFDLVKSPIKVGGVDFAAGIPGIARDRDKGQTAVLGVQMGDDKGVSEAGAGVGRVALTKEEKIADDSGWRNGRRRRGWGRRRKGGGGDSGKRGDGGED
jgi:hypothetical protein